MRLVQQMLVVGVPPCHVGEQRSGGLLLVRSAWQRGVARNLWMMAKGAVGG